jgi:hypothetical protein
LIAQASTPPNSSDVLDQLRRIYDSTEMAPTMQPHASALVSLRQSRQRLNLRASADPDSVSDQCTHICPRSNGAVLEPQGSRDWSLGRHSVNTFNRSSGDKRRIILQHTHRWEKIEMRLSQSAFELLASTKLRLPTTTDSRPVCGPPFCNI